MILAYMIPKYDNLNLKTLSGCNSSLSLAPATARIHKPNRALLVQMTSHNIFLNPKPTLYVTAAYCPNGGNVNPLTRTHIQLLRNT